MIDNWIDTKDVAKLVRKELKAEVPNHKFSVRISRYSMGSSVHVQFKTEGATDEETQKVREICDKYQGRGFDGMTDSEYSVPVIIDGEEYRTGCYVFGHSFEGYSI